MSDMPDDTTEQPLPMDDPTNALAFKLLGCSILLLTRPFWAVKLDDDRWICEAHWKKDLYRGGERLTDWTHDLVSNGLTDHIKELWLFCPPGPISPLGNTAMLPISEPGTAFQLKVAHFFSNIAAGYKDVRATLIGRIDDKASGECTVFIYDHELEAMFKPWSTSQAQLTRLNGETSSPWRQNIHEGLGTWVEGSIAPIGKLAHDVLGLKAG